MTWCDDTWQCVVIWLTHNTVLLVTAWYSPLTSCSNDTAVVWGSMFWRIVGWRWRINVELIVQHVSTICQTTIVYLAISSTRSIRVALESETLSVCLEFWLMLLRISHQLCSADVWSQQHNDYITMCPRNIWSGGAEWERRRKNFQPIICRISETVQARTMTD